MRSICIASIGAIALVASACDKGTTSDPATVSRSTLNPPTGLISVTDKDGLELRWDAANAEDDVKGYDVFVIKGTLAALTAPSFPKNITPTPTLAGGSFPRCKDNSDFFKTNFGFAASERDCEGDAEATTSSASTVDGQFLDEGSGSTTATTEKLSNLVPCDGKDDTTISLPATTPILTQQVCKVTQFWDTTQTPPKLMPMVAGETYVAFVAAIAGTDKNSMSWTSNFIEDAPNARLFDGKITIAQGKTKFFSLAKLIAFTAATKTADADWDVASCSGDSICRINKLNTGNADGLWIGRRGTEDSSYPQRLLFSTPSDGAIESQLRGPQTFDPSSTTPVPTIPGDEATATYLKLGTHYPIYGNQVFDLKVTSSSKTYYGKVVFFTPDPVPTAVGTDITMRVVVIMQPLADSHHYLQ